MNAIRQAAFLRPISRSSSPAPSARNESGVIETRLDDIPITRTSSRGPLNRLTLSAKKSRSSIPIEGTPPGTPSPPQTLLQDGSYLEALSLKLSEGTSKALAPAPLIPSGAAVPDDVFNGRRALPAGRGRALGNIISGELNAAKDNVQLQRAIVRQLHRPLSVLLTNLSAQLLPIISSPKFNPTEWTPSSSAAQLHALALAAFARELLQAFDEMRLGVTGLSDARGDGLQGVREGLEHIIGRVVNPLVASIKQDLYSIVPDLEKDRVDSWIPKLTSTPSPFKPTFPNQRYHPAFNALSSHIATHVKTLERCLTVGGKLVEHNVVGVTIGIAWRGLVALAHRRPNGVKPLSRQSTPPSAVGAKKKLTPPTTPRMALSFRPSRPPSPTFVSLSRAADAKALYDILVILPRPSVSNELACEALDEAFEATRSLSVLFDTLDTFTGAVEDSDLEVLTKDLPTLIALPVLLNAPNVDKGNIKESVPGMLHMEEREYRQTCLPSFGREEECAETVSRQLVEVLEEKGAGDTAIARWLRSQADE